VIALICDGTIFLKITPGTTKILEDAATWPAYPGSKYFYILPEEILENHSDLIDLIRTCAQDVPVKKKKK
jgi:TfoX/Sxy family transcriptional regulator of competence genes